MSTHWNWDRLNKRHAHAQWAMRQEAGANNPVADQEQRDIQSAAECRNAAEFAKGSERPLGIRSQQGQTQGRRKRVPTLVKLKFLEGGNG